MTDKHKKIYLYGAGGHAKVIIDIMKANNMSLAGIVDDNIEIKEFMGNEVIHYCQNDAKYIISIGNNRIRQKIAEKLSMEKNCTFDKIIHPSAITSQNITIGCGSVVMQNSVIQSGTQIGKHCIINTAAAIDHDCKIGNFVHISPNATLCGEVSIGDGSWIGAGSVIIQGIKIGKNCIIGAGSVVCKDIPDGVVAFGNPCKIRRKNNN